MRLYELLTGASIKIEGSIWCTDGSLIDPSKLRDSGKVVYGYALSDDTIVRIFRTKETCNWNEAKNYCINESNSGRIGYMPSCKELSKLYYSVMNGRMMLDLMDAGLYDRCNYRNDYEDPNNGWQWVWGSDEYSEYAAYYVHYYGGVYDIDKKYDESYVIPFFKI